MNEWDVRKGRGQDVGPPLLSLPTEDPGGSGDIGELTIPGTQLNGKQHTVKQGSKNL